MAREWFYNPGDNWLLDDISGFKIRRSNSRTIPGGQTGNAVVAPKRWEPQQPQDFVRGVVDDQTVPIVRSRQANQFTVLGTYVTAAAATGASAVTIADPAGFMVGYTLQIMLDSGDNFRTNLAAINGDTFDLAAPLPGSVGMLYGDPIENTVLAISGGTIVAR